MREELEEMIGYEMSDPRVGTVNVASVTVSPDFRHAFVSLVLDGTAEEQAVTVAALEHAKQFLRHQLAERLEIFRMPELHFEANLPSGLAAKAPQILKRMRRGRPKDEKNAIS
jgi:ribosome-binding factor A